MSRRTIGAIAKGLSIPSITGDDLRKMAIKGIMSLVHMTAQAPRGTHGKVIQRKVRADGRVLHPTKGLAKTERGGYAKRSRRSNGT